MENTKEVTTVADVPYDKGVVGIIHNSHKAREVRFSSKQGFIDRMAQWYHEIKPALRRGEKVSIELQLKYND